MKKYYLMAQKISENSTSLYQRSHDLTLLQDGRLFPKDFCGSLLCDFDVEYLDGVMPTLMPTFYMSPAIIGTKQFYQDLLDCGIDNIEVKPVIINNPVSKVTNDDYVLLNILGRIPCADMEKSEYGTIGEDMHVINKLVINPEKVNGLDIFLADEDTDCIIISEKVYKHLNSKGYTDIYFEELK